MMDPQAAFVFGALVASLKGVGLVAIGAGIAWWRARRRVRELEAQLADAALAAAGPDLAQLEQGLDFLAEQVRAIADEQRTMLRRLPLPPGAPTEP
ncbi:MAG: hypothetical protein ACM3OH_04210 [Bacillota bacterium]|jgi:hypothetical protein